MTAVHTAVKECALAKYRRVTKSEFLLTKRLRPDDLILPPECDLSRCDYLASLNDDDMVEFSAQQLGGNHGLCRKESNNKKTQVRSLFIKYITENRSATGRTLCGEDNRYHGAQFYLDSSITTLRYQPKEGRQAPLRSQVLELVINNMLKATAPGLSMGGSTMVGWMSECFGPGSALGHTCARLVVILLASAARLWSS